MSLAFSLLKLRYHLSYASVVIGALLFAPSVEPALASRLAVLYVAFNLLFYCGIYTFNDIADRNADRHHPAKCRRPVAAGRIPVQQAAVAAGTLVASGLTIASVLFSFPVVLVFAAVLAINAAYSLGGRNVPCVDILLNSAPHPLRFLLGVLLVGRVPPIGHLMAWLCLAAGIACLRRIVEQDECGAPGRPTLAWYSREGLWAGTNAGLLSLLTLAVIDGLASPGFYAVVLTGYVVLVLGGRREESRRSLGVWLWQH